MIAYMYYDAFVMPNVWIFSKSDRFRSDDTLWKNPSNSNGRKCRYQKYLRFSFEFSFLKSSYDKKDMQCVYIDPIFPLCCRHNWFVWTHHTLPRWDDICCQRDGKNWLQSSSADRWRHNLKVSSVMILTTFSVKTLFKMIHLNFCV